MLSGSMNSRAACRANGGAPRLSSSALLSGTPVKSSRSTAARRQGAKKGMGGSRLTVKANSNEARTVEKVPVSLVDAIWGSDESHENARKYRRTVFNFDKWQQHRSSARYARHITTLFSSRIARALAKPILSVVLIATGVCVYETLRVEGKYIPSSWPTIAFGAGSSLNLTNFALSLLLVFRTNTSFGRWDEARKIWGGILNRTRDIVRQSATYFRPEEQELSDMMARWTIAFAHSTKDHLRNDTDLEADLKAILLEDELKALLASTHRPVFVMQVMTEIIRSSSVKDSPALFRMDENVTFFEDAVGACERIFKTPIVLSYTRHTSRTLVIWLAFLPFSLWPAQGWSTIPSAAIISFLLLGIEEIGVQIEEPFSILALEAMCESVEGSVRQMQANRAADPAKLPWSKNFQKEPLALNGSVPPPSNGSSSAPQNGGYSAPPPKRTPNREDANWLSTPSFKRY